MTVQLVFVFLLLYHCGSAEYHDVIVSPLYMDDPSRQFSANKPETVTLKTSVTGKVIDSKGQPLFKADVFFADREKCAIGEVYSLPDLFPSSGFVFIHHIDVTLTVTLQSANCDDVYSLCIDVSPADCADWRDVNRRNNVVCVGKLDKYCPKPGRKKKDSPLHLNSDGCPFGWFSRDFGTERACYGIVNTRRNFKSAQAYCRLNGGELASINDAQEQRHIANAVSLMKAQTSHDSHYWFGLHKANESDAWTWTDGSTSVYRHWEKTEIEDFSPGDQGLCAVMQTSSACASLKRIYKWTFVPCERYDCYGGIPFICKTRINDSNPKNSEKPSVTRRARTPSIYEETTPIYPFPPDMTTYSSQARPRLHVMLFTLTPAISFLQLIH